MRGLTAEKYRLLRECTVPCPGDPNGDYIEDGSPTDQLVDELVAEGRAVKGFYACSCGGAWHADITQAGRDILRIYDQLQRWK